MNKVPLFLSKQSRSLVVVGGFLETQFAMVWMVKPIWLLVTLVTMICCLSNRKWIALKKEIWLEAMKQEMESMYSNSVWDLVEAPSDFTAIGYKWIYKKK